MHGGTVASVRGNATDIGVLVSCTSTIFLWLLLLLLLLAIV